MIVNLRRPRSEGEQRIEVVVFIVGSVFFFFFFSFFLSFFPSFFQAWTFTARAPALRLAVVALAAVAAEDER